MRPTQRRGPILGFVLLGLSGWLRAGEASHAAAELGAEPDERLLVPWTEPTVLEALRPWARAHGFLAVEFASPRRLSGIGRQPATLLGYPEVRFEELARQGRLRGVGRGSSAASHAADAFEPLFLEAWLPVARGARPLLDSWKQFAREKAELRLRHPTREGPESWLLAAIAEQNGLEHDFELEPVYLPLAQCAGADLPLEELLARLEPTRWTIAPWDLVARMRERDFEITDAVPNEGLPAQVLGVAFTVENSPERVTELLGALALPDFRDLCGRLHLLAAGPTSVEIDSQRVPILSMGPELADLQRAVVEVHGSVDPPLFRASQPWYLDGLDWLLLLVSLLAAGYVLVQIRRGRWSHFDSRRSP